MENPFKNNSLASCLLGIFIGIGGYVGGNALLSNTDSVTQLPIDNINQQFLNTNLSSSKSNPTFHGLENNPDGDVVITKSGKKYHSKYGCSSLKSNSKTRIVNRDDAEKVGVEACSKCNP